MPLFPGFRWSSLGSSSGKCLRWFPCLCVTAVPWPPLPSAFVPATPPLASHLALLHPGFRWSSLGSALAFAFAGCLCLGTFAGDRPSWGVLQQELARPCVCPAFRARYPRSGLVPRQCFCCCLLNLISPCSPDGRYPGLGSLAWLAELEFPDFRCPPWDQHPHLPRPWWLLHWVPLFPGFRWSSLGSSSGKCLRWFPCLCVTAVPWPPLLSLGSARADSALHVQISGRLPSRFTLLSCSPWLLRCASASLGSGVF